MNTTRFKTVAEAAAHLAEDPHVAKRVENEISRNAVVTALLEMRVAKGLTQEDIANSMGCDASKISRIESIESGNDRQLKWTDIVGYAAALKLQMSILFDDESLPAAARIKQCVFQIDNDLKRLAGLAKSLGGDDEISRGIDRFYKQVLFNFLMRFSEHHEQLRAIINVPAKAPQPCLTESVPQRTPELVPETTQPTVKD